MGKKYTTDEISIGDHSLDSAMMSSLASIAGAGLHSDAGYLTTYTDTDTNTQLSDAQIAAMGYIKTYTDTNTQLTSAQIAAMGYFTSLPSHNHDDRHVKEGGTSFSGVYPMVVRVGARSIYSDADITFTGSTSQLYVGGSIKAPIFYDTNNTSYYLDPASTSNLNIINATGGTSTQWNTAHGWGNHADAGYLTALPSHNHDTLYLGKTAKAADSELLDGLDLHTKRNNEANKVVRTNSSGYADFGWINTTSGVTTGTPTRIYCSQDSYLRYYTPAQLAPFLLNQGSTKNSHTHDYLGSTAKAADSNLLDGINSTSFLRSDAGDSFSGTLVGGAQRMMEPNDYGKGVYGKYSSTKFQHVWGMGSSWHLDASGSSLGNFYGIAYTHSNVGSGSQSGFSHQTLFVAAGSVQTWIGTGVRTVGDLISDASVKAPIFYDSNNTGYYVNPASTSNLNAVTWSGGNSANANTAYTHSQAAHAPSNANYITNNNQLTNGAGYITGYTDTNTWRGIDDTPVNGQTAESISSNWAYDHAASSTAHPRDTRSQVAGSYAASSHSHSYLPLSGGNISGGLTIDGSLSRGSYVTLSQYHAGADNIVLKGNASGISGIFFESEKDGTNINHTSDFGFIQFHPYGTLTTGESAELIIGTSNDADDHIILNTPNINGVKMRVGSSETDYTVYHSGNLSLSTLGYTGATNANYITNNNQLTNGAEYITDGNTNWNNTYGFVTSSGNTIIGTDTDVNTSGATIIDNLYMTDGVITSHGTRVLSLGDLGYTGATNANYITNNTQLTNGAGYTTYTTNQALNTSSSPTFEALTLNGDLLVNWNGTSSNIRMGDTDHGERRIHCNSNRIGFLNSSNGWGAYSADNGDWTTDTISYAGASMRAPVFYDSNNTAYVVNPASTSTFANINAANFFGTLIGTATNADLLDNIDSGSFLRSDATDYQNNTIYQRGYLVNEDSYRDRGVYGHYNSTKTNHIWSMGTAYKNNASGANFGNLYGLAYKHTNNTTGGSMAGGHQMVWCTNGTGRSAMGDNIWTLGNVKAPIFYDSNNTGYYLDPASTSNLNALNVNGTLTAANGGTFSGNVGIGTTNTATTLDVLGTYRQINPGAGAAGGTVIARTLTYSTSPYGLVTRAYSNGLFTIQCERESNAGQTFNMALQPTGGYLGVGTVSPSYKLDVSGAGRFTSTVNAINFILSSDERKKTKIKDLERNNINANWKSFEMKNDEGEYRTGVIAQELEETHPEFVNTDPEGFKSVKYIDLLIAKIAELEARLEKAGI